MLGTSIVTDYDGLQPDYVEKKIDHARAIAREVLECEERAQQANVRTQTIVRAIHYPDGMSEVVGYQVNVHKHLADIRAFPKAARGESEDREKSIDVACRRARKTIRLKLKAIRADHLLTLTYRKNMQDHERAQRDLQKFVRRVSKLTSNALRGFKYVLVLEYQERGAIHFHIGVHGWQNVKVLRAIWYEIVGRGEGQINVRGPKTPGDQRVRGVHQLAQYLSKYITKDATASALNKKRYWASKGIEVPERETIDVRWADTVEGAFQDVFHSLCATHNLHGMSVYFSAGRDCFWISTADKWYEPPVEP
ncbi:rolling circle replication-associated protein [Cupriavidus metallidurans]|uniref:rolling circle replication-associated protein n=1 Tax=Cupriavidus metallidurans TaxID=119219 RepID=UPI0035C6D028